MIHDNKCRRLRRPVAVSIGILMPRSVWPGSSAHSGGLITRAAIGSTSRSSSRRSPLSSPATFDRCRRLPAKACSEL